MSILKEHADDIVLILSDHLMPGQLGASFLREANLRWPTIPSMLLTGYEEDKEVMDVVSEGIVFSVLSKPWHREVLMELIEKILG